MADIELVIKIPEGLKKNFESEQWTALSCMEMKDALMNGVPLPEGHGRIVDIGPYEGKVIASHNYCGVNKLIEVAELDTIIEADTEVEAPESMEKLQKIEQIIKDHDNDRMPEDYFYIDKIREVLNNGEN